jgi:hypothetical protein
MKKLFLLGFVVVFFGAAILLFKDKTKDPQDHSTTVLVPSQNQVLVRHVSHTLSWQVDTKKNIPFTILFLLKPDGTTIGTITATSEHVFEIKWDVSSYYQGDMGLPLPSGRYKIKVVGFDDRFCFNGECSPDAKTSANELFQLLQESFKFSRC